jgi:hypothetical protein
MPMADHYWANPRKKPASKKRRNPTGIADITLKLYNSAGRLLHQQSAVGNINEANAEAAKMVGLDVGGSTVAKAIVES